VRNCWRATKPFRATALCESRFTRPARDDLREIGDWIAKDNPARAMSFVDELIERALSLAQNPQRFPVALERANMQVRKATCQSYLIFYIVHESRVEVIRVMRASRNWPLILGDMG
jgi:toxin ParE1/3/4